MEGQALIIPEGEGVDITENISPSACTSTTPNNRAPISARETYPPPLPVETRKEELNASTIVLRLPRIYQKGVTGEDGGGGERWQPPSLEWLEGTWSVTHSTLGMWRKAKNVRISYKIIPKGNGKEALLDDLVASVPTEKTWMPQPSQIHGIDTPDGLGAWRWRGKGLLKIASSRWEILGWGKRDGEKWVVTWFAPSLFTPMGIDLYCDRKEGMSGTLETDIMKELGNLEAGECVELVREEMRKVMIEY